MFKKFLRWILGGFLLLLLFASAVYISDINRAYERISGKSTVITSPYGDIEYTTRGTGPYALVIHGSGGGYDQGELIAETVLGEQFKCIIPSRFGYLKSTFHEGATFDDQADAYAYLLDHLGIDDIAVIALSHGGPSALLFALLHPDRVSSLTLISAGVASVESQDQIQANRQGDMLVTIYKYDFLYWATTKLFKKQFMKLMGASNSVIADLTPQQIELVEHLIDYMNPVSTRSDGVRFDNQAMMPNDRIANIKSPTLILHATDDTLQLYHNAQYAVDTIPDAKLIRYDRGGHLLVIIEQDAIREFTREHILSNIDSF